LQCNHASVDCSGNRIIGNRIEGNGGPQTRGIIIEKDYGKITGTSVDDNEILNTNVGIYIGAGVVGARYSGGVNQAVTPLVDRGEATIVK
jgi:hypothetical protein